MAHNYRIEIKGSGGEFCLGSISEKSGDYWIKQSKSDFLQHLNDPSGGSAALEHIGVGLPNWHDIDNFFHAYGIENVERIIVSEDADPSQTVGDSTEPDWSAMIIRQEPKVASDLKNHSGYKVFSRSREKGYCIIDLSIEAPFDFSKLKLHEVEFWGHEIVIGLTYDDKELSFGETFGRSYADNECVLHDPNGQIWFSE